MTWPDIPPQYFITPVSHINFRGRDLQIPMSEGTSGSFTAIFRTILKNIMYGKENHEWGHIVHERQLDA